MSFTRKVVRGQQRKLWPRLVSENRPIGFPAHWMDAEASKYYVPSDGYSRNRMLWPQPGPNRKARRTIAALARRGSTDIRG